jgi:hypothetical protein
MSTTPEPAPGVTELRRPPIRQSTLVRSNAAHTFDVFVRSIGSWWPVRPYSKGNERVASVTLEERLGGRFYETWDDGSEQEWGEVLAWDPPKGFTVTWEITPATTEVELTFRALGPSLTRVELEHRGWERLTDEELASVSPESGINYSKGWERILAEFAAAAGGAGTEGDDGARG